MKRGTCQKLEEESAKKIKSETGTMLQKWENSSPYNLFFTKIPNITETLSQENAISFSELLCPSLGNLKSSLQINFIVDLKWLLEQYKFRNLENTSITILYGLIVNRVRVPDNVICREIIPTCNYGRHHTKLSIYLYDDDSVRIVVSSANLRSDDWNNFNQGIWVSPRCPSLLKPSDKKGESSTGFKKCFLTYLKNYKNYINMTNWINIIKKTDFTNIKVFFITSVSKNPKNNNSHWQQMRQLLSKYCNLKNEDPKSWDIVAQASSLASFERSPCDWLETTFMKSLAAHIEETLDDKPKLKIIFPSKRNVANCLLGQKGSDCLSNCLEVYSKQKWLKNYLHQWKADNSGRTQVMPHIKTYCRVSPCFTKLAWFLLTSANISRGAWGFTIQADKEKPYVLSYEAGVLFIPEFFGEKFFEVARFPFVYDLPLTPYDKNDEPFCHDPNRKFE